MACIAPEGYVAASSDCDDTHAQVYPNATEICDDIDNDCDSLVDDFDADVAVPVKRTILIRIMMVLEIH